MNTVLQGLKDYDNYTLTENGGVALKSTQNAVYDMFSVGAAYRKRSDEDCILLFKNAFEENETLAMKCLFYIRDCRGGGQGERRFFRTCYHWLAQKHPQAAARDLRLLSEYGRWDDLYCVFDTPLEKQALAIIKHQLALDMSSYNDGPNEGVSLLSKWLCSENASSAETKRLGNKIRQSLGMTHKQYRKTLSKLRERINVLERLMSANRWQDIDFSKIPSKAGLIYKNAFARRDIIAKKYEAFAKDKKTKVNADTLYPYEIVAKAISHGYWGYDFSELSDTDRAIIEKYWDNQKDYLGGKPCKMMCVVDTSGSMTGRAASAPLNVAISLGMYCAERIGGPFKDHFISFSTNPQLIKIEGVDFVDKVRRIYKRNECFNTNLHKTFDLLRKVSKTANPEDRIQQLLIISDMQIDRGSDGFYFDSWWDTNTNTNINAKVMTEMEKIRAEWEADGLQCPKLVYWNVDARGEANILDNGPDVSYVSGFSPVLFESVLSGKTGWDLCLEKLMSKRYEAVK